MIDGIPAPGPSMFTKRTYFFWSLYLTELRTKLQHCEEKALQSFSTGSWVTSLSFGLFCDDFRGVGWSDRLHKMCKLVGGLESLEHDFFDFPDVWNVIIPTDELHHFSEGYHQAASFLLVGLLETGSLGISINQPYRNIDRMPGSNSCWFLSIPF